MRISTLNENDLADLIRKAGIPVKGVAPAAELTNAIIEITDLVHVGVPAFGGYPGVVREVSGTQFVFGPEQSTLEGLVEQIRFHLEQAGQEVIQAVASAEDDYILDNGPSPC